MPAGGNGGPYEYLGALCYGGKCFATGFGFAGEGGCCVQVGSYLGINFKQIPGEIESKINQGFAGIGWTSDSGLPGFT